MKDLETELAIQHSKPNFHWNWSCRSDMRETKFIISVLSVPILKTILSYKHKRGSISIYAYSHDTAYLLNLRERLKTWITGLEESMSLLRDRFSGKTDFPVGNVEWPAFISQIFSLGLFIGKIIWSKSEIVPELKEASGKKITSFGSEVTKAFIDSVEKRP